MSRTKGKPRMSILSESKRALEAVHVSNLALNIERTGCKRFDLLAKKFRADAGSTMPESVFPVAYSMCSSGSFGFYTTLNGGRGIKAISSTMSETLSDMRLKLNRPEVKAVFLEAAYFNLFYGARIAQVRLAMEVEKCKYYLCIRTPHFPGSVDWDLMRLFYSPESDSVARRQSKRSVPLLMFVQAMATRAGLMMNDLHGDNVLIDYKKRPWVIDFSPEGIQHFGSQERLSEEIEWLKQDFLKARIRQG